MSLKVTFRVIYSGKINRRVAVVGDSPQLGKWNIEKAFRLQKEDKQKNVWTGSTTISPTSPKFKYIVFSTSSNRLVEWETFNRHFNPNSAQPTTDTFGENNCKGASVDHGWLNEKVMVKLYWDGWVKTSIEDVEVKISTGPECSVCKQADFYSIFAPNFEKILIYFHCFKNKEFIGKACITMSQLSSFYGKFTAPILNVKEFRVIGEITTRYLVIFPFKHDNNTLENVWRSYWSPRPMLYVGHRGMGKSNGNPDARITENTLLSFNTAAGVGVDFLEFDLQLTRDNQVIVFHDFTVPLMLVNGKKIEIPVKDLKLDQLKEIVKTNSYFKKSSTLSNLSGAGVEETKSSEEICLFEDLFDSIPPHVGFNVEIKYPMDDELEDLNIHGFHERNFYLDTILKIIFDKAKDRRIVISSFDPDICYMCALKQPRYPVFFLTEAGEHIFKDPRCNSIPEAIKFVKSHLLRGIVSDSKPLLKDKSLIKLIKDEGMLLFTYGEVNTKPENVAIQKKHGIDAVICDNVGDVIASDPERKILKGKNLFTSNS